MGTHPKGFIESFFDIEEKKKYYVLGAFYASYTPIREKGIKFTSSNYNLVEIIKDQLKSKHEITSDPRGKNSHWIEKRKAPQTYSKLEEIGLNVSKSERKFPKNIDEEHISHFVRGFLDAQAYVHNINDKLTNIGIQFNNSFLTDLHEILVKYAGVERNKTISKNTTYSHKDSLKIYNFIYSDWDYIKRHKLYLKSKKKLFKTEYAGDGSIRLDSINCIKRVNKAKELLLKGKKPWEVAKILNYSSSMSLGQTFKNKTGTTMREFLKENK